MKTQLRNLGIRKSFNQQTFIEYLLRVILYFLGAGDKMDTSVETDPAAMELTF